MYKAIPLDDETQSRNNTQPHSSLTAELDPAICWAYYLKRKVQVTDLSGNQIIDRQAAKNWED